MNGERARCPGVVLWMVVVMHIASSAASADSGDPQSRWYFRLGLVSGSPQLDEFELRLRALPGVTLGGSLGGSLVPQGSITVQPLRLLGGPVGLILPVLNNRLALETIVAVPRSLKVVASGMLASESILPTVFGVPTGIPPLGRDVVEVSSTSPLLTAVYRAPSIGPITPILGVGFIALLGFDVRFLSPVLKQYISVQVDSPPSLAPLVQAGADIRLWHRVQARIDVKYSSLSLDIALKNIQVKTGQLIGTVDLGDAEIRSSAHVWLVQAGVGLDL